MNEGGGGVSPAKPQNSRVHTPASHKYMYLLVYI